MITIDPEFKSFIPPLSEAEKSALEASLVAAGGATDPLRIAHIDGAHEPTLLDGHNRYEICERLGLRYQTRTLPAMTRAEAKAWMFEHQLARRNLSVDQLVMLAALRGLERPKNTGSITAWERAVQLVAEKSPRIAHVIAGKYTVNLAWGAHMRDTGRATAKAPRPPRGPTATIPEGHELAGKSTLTGPDGEVKATWDKTRVAGNDEPEPPPPDFALKRVSTMQRGDGSEVIRWASYDRAEAERYQAFLDAIDRHAKQYTGLVPAAPAPTRADSETLALYPIGDYHLGMLAWFREAGKSWDLAHGKIALGLVMSELVRMMPDSERAILVNLGDFLHAQDDAAVTPGHGNKLDVDGRHAKVADAALVVLVGAIDTLLRKHRHVTVRNLPGNHDPRVAAGLARELKAWYRNEPRVDIAEAYAAHQYDVFGKVLLGYHHGDRTPMKELPGIMATDMHEAWGMTRFRHWHCGHVHHKIGDKEHPGCTVETHRIIPPGDAWHAGRYRASRGMSAIVYDREYGEVSRATVGIERVASAIAKELSK